MHAPDSDRDLLADLTPPQRDAVTHVEGALLVLAGAGSGKTRVITRRVAYMLRRGVPGNRILALTFTNKAAGEMRERIDALAPRSGVWVGTFHGLCARLLRQYAELLGLDRNFTIYDQADRLRVIKQVFAELGLESSNVTPERVDGAISRAKNVLASPETLARDTHDPVAVAAAKVFKPYQERLRANSAVDFDDLLLHMVRIVKEHPDVRADLDARFRYILVDEYQDTNLAQYAIVRALSVDHRNLCVTGDPDQSIYGWRGANLGNILEFERDYPGCRVVKLEQNYRSTKNILAVADHLIRRNRRRKPKALMTENPSGERVEVAVYPTEIDEARAVVGRIASKVAEGEFGLRDFAIFTRVTALTRNFESALRAARLPYQVVGGMSYYERAEVKDVLAYLGLMGNPRDDVAFLRVVNTPPRGLGKTSIDKLVERARTLEIPLMQMARQSKAVPGLTERAAASLRDFSLLMDELATLRDQAAEPAVRRLIAAAGYREFLQKESKDQADDRLANIDELVSAAREFDREHPGGSVVEFLEDVSLSSAVDRWKSENGAVALMTLHASKGLEFPVVFIVGMEQGILPHARVRDNEAELEEERRLLFVGITRAQRELYLSRCLVREFRGQRQATIPSEFLGELPADVIIERDYTGTGLDPASFARPSQPRSFGGFDSRRNGAPPRFTTAAALAGGTSNGDSEPVDLQRFQPGVSVIHPQYGLGRIVAIDGAGPDRKGRVAFTLVGEKTFVLAKSPLRAVTRP
ncbi:MAG: UvrD-helicase domain-containing protein [Planctomycetota bacterium]|nr:UvrD-helicase domain-containing protein [Planctomycetota bacterium]